MGNKPSTDMHDPNTVAFEIKNPFARKRHGYRPSLLTIWHHDPENFKFKDGTEKQGGGRDDSCGWSRPMYHIKEWEAIEKLAKEQYRQLFERQIAESERKDYAYVCNIPETTYEVIYWVWRSIKAHGKKGWQFGNQTNFLTPAELERIMILATNPVDNFKPYQGKPTDEEWFLKLFRGVWTDYRRFNRPWYKHPRWHVHHWRLQFHPYQDLKRRYWDKCSICGKRGFKGSAYGDWSGTKIWHSECDKTNRVPSNHLPQ